MFRSFLELFEFYVAYRILGVAFTVIFCIACAFLSPKVIGAFFFALACLFVLAVPFVLVWAVCVFISGLRRF